MSNPFLSTVTDYCELSMNLAMEGTILFANTHTPSNTESVQCSQIQVTSPTPWDLHIVRFPRPTLTLEAVMDNKRQVSTTTSLLYDEHGSQGYWFYDTHDSFPIFNLNNIQRRISSMSTTVESSTLTYSGNIRSGTTDPPLPPTFQSSDSHFDITPQSLSEK